MYCTCHVTGIQIFQDSQGMTVLHVAAQKSNLDIINLLMNTHKLDVNEQDNGGWTALMWTAEGMRMDVAECLLNWGANVNILDSVSGSFAR